MSQRSVTKRGTIHSVPQIYGCYILRSIPKPNSFYIGSTPDPVRRLRQHNGELKAGAYKTKRKGYRPWEMVMLVYGFPNKIAALQFEHAWQHPYQTRHIEKAERITSSKTAGRSYAHKLGNVRLLIKSEFFSRMNLKIQFFNSDSYKLWCDNKFGIHAKIDLRSLGFTNVKSGDDDLNMNNVKKFKATLLENDKILMESFGKILQGKDLKCSICDEKIDYVRMENIDLVSICYHNDCHNLTHLRCLRSQFYENQDGLQGKENSNGKLKPFEVPQSELIPNKGKCPSCEKILFWSEAVSHSTRIRYIHGFGSEQPDIQEMEEDDFEENLEDNDLLQSQKQQY